MSNNNNNNKNLNNSLPNEIIAIIISFLKELELGLIARVNKLFLKER